MKQCFLFLTLLIGISACASPSPEELTPTETSETEAPMAWRVFDSQDLDHGTAPFYFQAEIPSSWQVEYIPEIEALNFYDPASSESSSLDRSQIFVRTFSASQFLTLSTVTIYSQTEFTINDRPAVTYDIEKKSDVADFPHQPFWRNQRHTVTDLRSTDDSPTVFYVFAARPDLDPSTFDTFLNSVGF